MNYNIQKLIVTCTCIGWCACHSMITIVGSYLLLHIVGSSMAMVVLMFLFNMVGVQGASILFSLRFEFFLLLHNQFIPSLKDTVQFTCDLSMMKYSSVL